MKTIVISGVTRGLVRALAEELIRLGHTVVGCGRTGEAVIDLRFTHPQPHRFDALDVADSVRTALWAESVTGTHPDIDIVVANAALMNDPAPLWRVPPEDFSRIVDVNIKGVAHLVRGFVPHMIARGRGGAFVALSSGWGRSVSAGVAPYCATKWAVEGLMKALAEDLPDGFAAVPLDPGVIDTDMLRQVWGGRAGGYERPDSWARRAAPFLLRIGPRDNGRSLSVPRS